MLLHLVGLIGIQAAPRQDSMGSLSIENPISRVRAFLDKYKWLKSGCNLRPCCRSIAGVAAKLAVARYLAPAIYNVSFPEFVAAALATLKTELGNIPILLYVAAYAHLQCLSCKVLAVTVLNGKQASLLLSRRFNDNELRSTVQAMTNSCICHVPVHVTILKTHNQCLQRLVK